MNAPTIIQAPNSPSGELVILDVESYRSLADSVQRLEARVADLQAGNGAIPGAIVRRIMAEGENPILVWREHRGLKAADLARRAGMSRSYLAGLEAGSKPIAKAAVGIMAALADALDCEIEDLLPPID